MTAEEIEGLAALSSRPTKESKIALASAGKVDRNRKSKKETAGKSTTNKEKARKKNIMMTLGKAKHKQKRSLTETRKVLKGHIDIKSIAACGRRLQTGQVAWLTGILSVRLH